MLRTIPIAAFVAAVLSAGAAAGQTLPARVYVGGTAAIEGGDRANVTLGAVPSAGAVIGLGFGGAWSVELEVDRGFSERTRTDEAIGFSVAPAGSSRAEIERLGIRMRWVRTDKAGAGWSGRVTWRTRDPGRVNAALFLGPSARHYTKRTVRTTLSVPADANLPPDYRELQPSDTVRKMSGTGLSAGLLVPIRVTPHMTVAPELRYTLGLITDDRYQAIRLGLRVEVR